MASSVYSVVASGSAPTWTYNTYGSYTAKVRVTDDDGARRAAGGSIERGEADVPEIAIGKPSFQFQQQGGGDGRPAGHERAGSLAGAGLYRG